jgi:glycosyltransferase involved in cell wall biosynthesis
MPKMISDSHFGIAICKFENQVSLAAAVPTKIGEFLASGRPVIVSEGIGDLDQMISSTQTGVIVENNDTLQDVTREIIKLVDDANTPARCRELALQHFDMGNSIDRYSEIYNRMLKSSSAAEVD